MRPKDKITLLIVLLSIIFILLLASLYLFYVNLKTCPNEECFSESLVKCARTYFINDAENTITEYKIQGIAAEGCKINVKLLQVKKGSVELAELEGEEMVCYTKLGTLSAPEADLSKCHGLLKEEIQDMIIKRMHAQIVENIGKISEETTKIL